MLRHFFLHCIGVRFRVSRPWLEVKAAIWAYARARGLEHRVGTMRGRAAGIYFTKEGLDDLFRIGGVTYVGFTPTADGLNVVVKGFEDWFAVVAKILGQIGIDAPPRCEGVTSLEVAAMVRDNAKLRALLPDQPPAPRDRRIALLLEKPVPLRVGRRRAYAELEVYRLGSDDDPRPGDDPPGMVKVEVRFKVKRGESFTDHIHTDYASTDHFLWMFEMLADYLLQWIGRRDLTVVKRPKDRGGLRIPKDFLILNRAPASGRRPRRPAQRKRDEDHLREIAGARRRDRSSIQIQIVGGGAKPPTALPSTEVVQTATTPSGVSTRPTRPREVYLGDRPSKLEPGWNKVPRGTYRVRIQEAVDKALVYSDDRVELQLSLRVWILEGSQSGRTVPVVLYEGRGLRARQFFRALGIVPATSAHAIDLEPESLIGLQFEIDIERPQLRLSVTAFRPITPGQRKLPGQPRVRPTKSRDNRRRRALDNVRRRGPGRRR